VQLIILLSVAANTRLLPGIKGRTNLEDLVRTSTNGDEVSPIPLTLKMDQYLAYDLVFGKTFIGRRVAVIFHWRLGEQKNHLGVTTKYLEC
jgi:hypothetical protein